MKRIQGYLFARDINMCTRICLGDVLFIHCINGVLTNRHDITNSVLTNRHDITVY